MVNKKRHSVWNKGLPKEQQPMFSKKQTEETKKKIKKKLKGRPFSGIPFRWTGKKQPPRSKETRKKLSKSISKGQKKRSEIISKKNRERFIKYPYLKEQIAKKLRREKSHFWQGGKSFEPYSTDWKNALKRAIRERDHYFCRICDKYGNTV